MKATCPNCQASYQIDDSKIPDKGIYGRCPKCNHLFWIAKGTDRQQIHFRKEDIPEDYAKRYVEEQTNTPEKDSRREEAIQEEARDYIKRYIEVKKGVDIDANKDEMEPSDQEDQNDSSIIKEHRINFVLLGLILFLKIGDSTGFLSEGLKVLTVVAAAILGFPALIELMNSKFTLVASTAWVIVMFWVFLGGSGILRGY